jgi:hypothetical protein
MVKRRRSKPSPVELGDRLADQAKRLHEQALEAPPGPERDRLMQLARQAETGSKMSAWLKPQGQQRLK